jgi:uncharacterized protein YcbK (DUF882 family)
MASQKDKASSSSITRRSLLALGSAAAATLLCKPASAALRLTHERSLSLYNIHTGEHLREVYWAGGRYLPDALHAITYFLRDFRSDQIHHMDPHALDIIAAVHRKCEARGPVHIISGYRSPATNAWLRSVSGGVARHSLHMQGQAIDIRLPGHSVHNVGRAAMSLRAGGVGMYPASDFVHVDTGRVRYW